MSRAADVSAPPSTPAAFMAALDHQAVGDEALAIFRDLLRIDTSNSPDHPCDEIVACEYLADVFGKEGVEHVVLESGPRRGNIVARLPATKPSGAKPILLSAHLDVVPADPRRWDVPPFAAEIVDGFLYGRGTIDMKNMAAMEVATLLALKRQGVPTTRDVIFAGVADEEAGCEFGSLWLARNHPDLIRGEYAISEIGGFTMHVGGQRFYPIQVAEKGIAWLTIKARGTPGHGSLPNEDNPIPKIARAAETLGTRRLPAHPTPVVRRFIDQLAAKQPTVNRMVLRALLRPALTDFILDSVFPEKSLAATFDAALHNTANPTLLRAGVKINQVPGEATLQVDGRLLPGFTAQDLVSEVQQLIGPGYDVTVDRSMLANVTDANDPIEGLIREVIGKRDPEAAVIHTMIPGFTDAKAYNELGMKCWGFSPVKLPPELNFAQMFHGDNERIPVTGFKWGTFALMELIAKMVM